MKRLQLVFAILILSNILISCDNRKFLKEGHHVIPSVIVDSVAFDLVTDVDTIKTEVLNFGGYTWRFRCFDKFKKPLSSVNLPTSFHYLLNSGTQSYNNRPLNDTTLRSDTYYSFKYFPTLVNGKHEFDVALSNGYGKIFKDTVKFFVRTYTPTTFTYTFAPKTLPCLRPASETSFSVNLSSADFSKTIKYFLDFELPSNIINSQGSLKLGSNNFVSGSEISRGNNNFKLVLTGHPAGLTYKIPIRIYDQNGDSKYDTLVYNVVANSAPIVTNINSNFAQNQLTSSFGPIIQANLGTCKRQNYAYKNNIYSNTLMFNVGVTDDGINCSNIPKIQSLKITLPNGNVLTYAIPSGGSNLQIVVNNGQIVVSYPGNRTEQCLRCADAVYFVCPGIGWNYEYTGIPYTQWPTSWSRWIGIVNDGANTFSTNNEIIKSGDRISFTVQDQEGLWSQEKTFTVPSMNYNHPAVWF